VPGIENWLQRQENIIDAVGWTVMHVLPGQHITDLITGYDAIIVQGPATDDLLPEVAFARYGREHVQLQQVIWPNREDPSRGSPDTRSTRTSSRSSPSYRDRPIPLAQTGPDVPRVRPAPATSR
jgi:hypothetical protein